MESINVYVASALPLQNEEFFSKVYGAVSEVRRRKTDRYQLRQDKNLSLAAEYLLLRAAREMGIEQFEIAYSDHGKPYFLGAPYQFSLSHSHERVLCAIGKQAVGCDVEYIRDIDITIAKRMFTEDEYKILAQAKNEEEQKMLFFRLWTLKESYAKMMGEGIKKTPDSCGIDLFGDRPRMMHNHDKCSFEEFFLHDEYAYSVCSKSPYTSKFMQVDLISI